ncbi:EpsG family protein [Paludibacter jiangxiensis]|uniref:EpsG family protein n=1 Tax=Paludibacter jiangxiensis TaxID=681398 RepID=A0A161LDY1_9BACT|nr:EpsG family protein [Paludibacter jiangxiensis]
MTDILSQLIINGKIYIILYIIFLSFLFFDFECHLNKYRYLTAFFSCVILWFFLSLRWKTGTDWDSYKELFDTLPLDHLPSLFSVEHFDLGYVFLNAISKAIWNNYTFFLCIDSFIAILIIYLLIRHLSTHPNLSLLIFYASFFLSHFMGSNRRMISIGLLLYAFIYTYHRQWFRYSVLQLIALLFHNSAIIGLIGIVIPKAMIKTKTIISLWIIGFFLGMIELPKLILEKFTTLFFSSNPLIIKFVYYTENQDNESMETINTPQHFLFAIIKRSLFLVLFIYYIPKIRNQKYDIAKYLFNLYFAGILVYMSFNGFAVLQTLSTYFAIIEIFLLAICIPYMTKTVRLLIIPILVIYCFMQILNSLSVYPEAYLPYQSILTFDNYEYK